MTRSIATALVVLAAVSVVPAAFGQPVPPNGVVRRPTVSPYLNILNAGGNPAINYLGIVRPQQQLAQQLGQLQQQTNLAAQAIDQVATNEANQLSAFLAPTGNVATFGNTGNYFNRFGAGGGGGGFNSGAVGFNRFGGSGGAAGIAQRPSYAGGSGMGGLSRPAAGGRR